MRSQQPRVSDMPMVLCGRCLACTRRVMRLVCAVYVEEDFLERTLEYYTPLFEAEGSSDLGFPAKKTFSEGGFAAPEPSRSPSPLPLEDTMPLTRRKYPFHDAPRARAALDENRGHLNLHRKMYHHFLQQHVNDEDPRPHLPGWDAQ